MKTALSLTGKLFIFIIFIAGLLGGCAPSSTPAPTQDPATLVAAAVQTLGAQMTEEALRNPTATPTPTETPVPPTFTPAPPTETPTPAFTPTETATTQPILEAEFLYAATYPENKREYVPNEKYGLALGFKNTGSLTWLPGYRLKLVNHQGEITVQTEAEMGQSVASGQKIEFNLWAFGSETLGKHVWVFQLYTGDGVPVPGGVAYFTYESK